MKQLILTACGDAPRSASSYAPSNAARHDGVTIDPDRGCRGLTFATTRHFSSATHSVSSYHSGWCGYSYSTLGRPYSTPHATGFKPSALIPKCNARSPVKGGGDVNLSGAAQQTHTNTQLCTIYHPV